jgi:16S rRNA (guanine1207-N2)-methyltransferase
VDRLLLHELASLLDDAAAGATVGVIDDLTGELALAAARLSMASVPVACDSLQDEHRVQRTLEAAEHHADEGPPGSRVHLVGSREDVVRTLSGSADGDSAPLPLILARLPKGLAALDELAEVVAAHAREDVTLLIGARDKFLSPSMNDVLRSHFGHVRATRGQQKSRALVAQDPRPGPLTYPRQQHHPDLALTVCAHGAAFAGTRVDRATRLLMSTFDRLPPSPHRIIDLGCGTGILAALVARERPQAQVVALDDSRAAVRSAQATAAVNGLAERVSVRRADVLTGEADASADIIVCNPPFHRGTTKDSTTALRMIADAGRVLRPGGELWMVYNAHLPYLPALRRQVGPTGILARDREYLVTRSARRVRRRLRVR